MKMNIEIRSLWRHPEVPSAGKEPYRTYFRAYPDRAQALEGEDNRICLSGNWRFKYLEDVNDNAAGFEEPIFDVCR